MPVLIAKAPSATASPAWTVKKKLFAGFGLLEPSPRVARYVERIQARPAYQASHEGF